MNIPNSRATSLSWKEDELHKAQVLLSLAEKYPEYSELLPGLRNKVRAWKEAVDLEKQRAREEELYEAHTQVQVVEPKGLPRESKLSIPYTLGGD